jgi:hypothetical protein
VAAQRVGEGRALLDGTGHPTGDVPQILGLALFSEDGEALHEGQTGIDHGGELAREDRHLLVLDLAPGLRLGLAPDFSLILVTRMARRRSSPTAEVRSAASISPVIAPAEPRPWYVNTAMSQPPV